MPNWKKVVVSGSAANLHSLNVSTDVTASNISSSGNIFGNLSENSSTSFKTVVVDPSTGQFYRTGSYGGGGGAGGSAFPFNGDGIISGSLLISSSNVGGVSTSSLTLQGSGSTIFDIQGSQGQLFSVTDDLIHDVFNVSDISGDTLLKVSGSGLVEIPVGNLSGSATSTASFGHYIGDGSELTGIEGFPFSGDAQITGSLSVSGSVSINDSLSNIIISTIGSGSSNATTVTGDHNIVIGMNAAEDLGASSDNVIIGNRAASGSVFSSTRENNVIIGTEAGADADMVDGANVVYIGYRAGYETTGYGAIHIGANAGQYADGNGNTSIGQNSMMGHASYGGTPLYNVVIGYNAGQQFWDGDNNVAIGSYAMANTAQHYNTSTGTVAVGSGAIRNNRKNNYTTAIGFNSLYALKGNDTNAGNYITAVGAYAGYTEEYGYDHTLIGYKAGYNLTASTGSIVIGYDAGSGISYMDRQLFIGSGSTALISGSLSGGLKLLGQVSASSYIGDGNGLTNISSTSLNGISLGLSTVVGDGASSAASYGNAFGKSATSTGGQNVVVGAFSSVAYGGVSLGHSTTGGQYTVAIGRDVGHASGQYNVLLGDRAGNQSSGNHNIAIGQLAGYNQTSGTGNITIGSGTQGVAGESNQLRIGHGLHGALISGSLSDGGVMIRGQVSASSYIGDGSGLTGISATAGSTSGRVVFTTTNGELTSEAGFTYDATTDRLTVPNLTTTTFTASFITSSTIETSGSNIFGDEAGVDVQTLIGTTKITGSAQITGSTSILGDTQITGSLKILPATNINAPVKIYGAGASTIVGFGDNSTRFFFGSSGLATMVGFKMYSGILAGGLDGGSQVINKVRRLELGGYGFGGTSVIGMVSPAGTVTVPGNGFAMYPDDANGAGTVSPHFKTEDGSILTLATTSSLKRVTADSSKISGSGGLTVESSGSTVFEVIGSQGTLFSINDDLDGTLLDVKDRSGIPVLQASASGEIYLGQSPQSLYTTAVISSTTADVTQSLYSLDTSSYGGAFFDYTAHSGSNARAGTVSSVWTPGGSVVFSETTTTHIGDTSNLNLVVHFSQSQAQLACYADTSQYNIKVITRAI